MGPLAVNVERSDVLVVLDAGQDDRVEVSLFLYFGTFSDVDVLARDHILLRVPSNLFQGTLCKYDVAGNCMIFEKKREFSCSTIFCISSIQSKDYGPMCRKHAIRY